MTAYYALLCAYSRSKPHYLSERGRISHYLGPKGALYTRISKSYQYKPVYSAGRTILSMTPFGKSPRMSIAMMAARRGACQVLRHPCYAALRAMFEIRHSGMKLACMLSHPLRRLQGGVGPTIRRAASAGWIRQVELRISRSPRLQAAQQHSD